jgi:hypothetical protein
VGLVLVIVLSGCADPGSGSQAASGIFFPTWRSTGGPHPTAILEGRLVERDGCLLLDTGDQREFLPLWPDSFALEGGSTPTIISPNGRALALGDQAFLGGGERRLVDAESIIGQEIPGRCRTSLYWLATAIEQNMP